MREYFEMAAAKNHSGALNGLGVYWLAYGNNTKLAADYFRNASIAGDLDGHYNYGSLLAHVFSDHGNITKNLTEAMQAGTISTNNNNNNNN